MNELATQADNPIEKAMRKASGPNYLQALRLVYAVSDAFKNKQANVDDYVLGTTNLGPNPKVTIGPRRYTNMRLKDGNLDLISHNLTPNASYNPETNDWNFPDGITPDFREIMDKKIPDNGQKLINMIGFEFLLYFPDLDQFGIYYLAKTAYTMTDLKEIMTRNVGRTAKFGTRQASSKNNSWSLPTLTLLPTNDTVPFPKTDEAADVLKQFLNPNIVSVMEEAANERPR